MGKWKESAGRRIAFIACSKTKNKAPCIAKDMYQGALFKKALTYCQKEKFDMIFILSAKYGILTLDEYIKPYDKTMKYMNRQERKTWAEKVKKKLNKLDGIFYFFAGQKYHEYFEGIKPLQGLSMGKQLQWFNKKLQPKGLEL